MKWQLADAKNRFSELVEKALTEGPQPVMRRNRDSVVVISVRDYQRLRGKGRRFKNFLMDGESLDGVDLRRDRTEARKLRL